LRALLRWKRATGDVLAAAVIVRRRSLNSSSRAAQMISFLSKQFAKFLTTKLAKLLPANEGEMEMMRQLSRQEMNIVCRALSQFQGHAKGDEAQLARELYYEFANETGGLKTLPSTKNEDEIDAPPELE
jgi:hypothetical protein